MSDDLIRREDAIEAIHSYWKGELSKMPTTDSKYGEVIDGDFDTLLKHNKELSTCIKAIPSADRPQGEWVLDPNGMDWNIPAWRCSRCGFVANYIGVEVNGFGRNPMNWSGSKYCPNCGAKMEGSRR